MLIQLDHAELASLRAALHDYMERGCGEPDNRTEVEHDLATDEDCCISLDQAGLESLDAKLEASLASLEDVNDVLFEPEAARAFHVELLGSVEALEGIVDEFNARTLVDLLYLQHAVLVGEKIDIWPGETMVGEALVRLPSAERWLEYTQMGGDSKEATEQAPTDPQ